ncbi:MAG TPA: sigma-54 dependent transcriptional regulator [Thermoanaerobaculia bacterium]|nr:sigma-54 dependent transcriptional regulator [Thermoanaerobaculia bacterium]
MSPAAAATPRILVADDQRDVREALRLLLKGEGFATESASSPAEVLHLLDRAAFDVVLMDLNYTRDTTSGHEGLDLLAAIRRADSTVPVVVMTAWATVELAVETMRRGARDFVEKPWDNARLLSIVRTQVELGRALRRGERLEAENRVLREDGQREGGQGTRLIARSRSMEPVIDLIERVGPSDANVLVTGANGTGKSLVARQLHAVSRRAGKPLVTVNTGGLSDTLFESEVFGHVRGAFTDARSDRVGRFELADGGTLFLDEIANITPSQQAKLLRVLETGEFERVGSSRTQQVDVRVISATNADLAQEVADGRFRQDLLFRLKTVEIRLPPLSERPEDVPALAAEFLERHARQYRKRLRGFTEPALSSMLTYAWPGNVRELDHAVERGVLMARGERVDAADLGLTPQAAERVQRIEDMPLEEVERLLIRKALARFDGNVTHAAHFLGLSRSALYRRLEKYELG